MLNQTLDYYDKHAATFSASTVTVDLHETQERFLDSLRCCFPNQSKLRILDFGCGSGRDTKYFLENGYDVAAVDGSAELCKLASEYTGIAVKHMLFEDLDAISEYHGIWACSSILHLSKPELTRIMRLIHTALIPSGMLYTSFKYSTFEGMRNGRYFTDFTEASFRSFLNEIEGFEIQTLWKTGDARKGREAETWLNLILKKV